MSTLPEYRYGSARTLVFLHGQYLRECFEAWRKARAYGIALPETDDPSYASLETLLEHVLGSARHYMRWMCEKLGLPDPGIGPAPKPEVIGAEAESYLAHLVDRWRLPLSEIDEERFNSPEHQSAWGVRYCIDAMLEHAVMHRVQLQELLEEQSSAV